jgi:Protein of unknown function (DUF3431)
MMSSKLRLITTFIPLSSGLSASRWVLAWLSFASFLIVLMILSFMKEPRQRVSAIS